MVFAVVGVVGDEFPAELGPAEPCTRAEGDELAAVGVAFGCVVFEDERAVESDAQVVEDLLASDGCGFVVLVCVGS